MRTPPLTERRALYEIAERAMGAIARKGSGKCRKLTAAVSEAFDPKAANGLLQTFVFREAQLVMRARCGLCEYRDKCKARLD